MENRCFIAEKQNAFANDFVCVSDVLLLKDWCVQKGYIFGTSASITSNLRVKSDSLLPTTSSKGAAHQTRALFPSVTFPAL